MKGKSINDITVAKASLAENSQRLGNEYPNTYVRRLGFNIDPNTNPNINGVGYCYQKNSPVSGLVASLTCDNYSLQFTARSDAEGPLYFRRFNTVGGSGSWQALAKQSDLTSLASLADIEKILSMETKEERAIAIASIKAEKLRLIELQLKENDMTQNNLLISGKVTENWNG
ncbi:MAG: hypothetical protein J1D77_03625 [Muribaculaceae bacterium]|nr:hypothetical protein [Muribaculaceae bacterium]